MDNSGLFPKLGDDDPLFEMSAYTQQMSNALLPAWTTLTLASGWAAYVGGGGYTQALRAKKIGTTVFVEGTIKGGAAGSTITTLPAGYYPVGTTFFTINTGGAIGMVQLSSSNGVISYFLGAAAPTYMPLAFSFQTV